MAIINLSFAKKGSYIASTQMVRRSGFFFFSNFSVRRLCYIAFGALKNMYACDIDADKIHRVSASNPTQSRIIVSNIQKPASDLCNKLCNGLVIMCMNDNKVHVSEFI